MVLVFKRHTTDTPKNQIQFSVHTSKTCITILIGTFSFCKELSFLIEKLQEKWAQFLLWVSVLLYEGVLGIGGYGLNNTGCSAFCLHYFVVDFTQQIVLLLHRNNS